MTGERINSAHLDGSINLHEYFQRQVDSQGRQFEKQISELRLLLDERYATQTKALDAAFAAADKAVQAALLSAEKAVTKAEVAAEKRFESVNEFRGQLSDQANTFLPRSEADVRLASLAEKVELISKQANNIELRVQSHLDLSRGKSTILDNGWRYLVGFAGLILVIINIFLAVKGFK